MSKVSTELPEVDYNRDVWEVIVQNIGRVYHGNDATQARYYFEDYVMMSKQGQGRAAGASVDLYLNGEPHKQHIGETEE